MATEDQFTFVLFPLQKQRRKDRELDLSRIRSHASKAVFRSRRRCINKSKTSVTPHRALTQRQAPDHQEGLVSSQYHRGVVAPHHSSQQQDQGVQTRNTKYQAPAESKALQRRYDKLSSNSSWQWGHGLRSDPFKILSGGRDPGPPVAVDFVLEHGSPIMSALAESFGVPDIYGRWLFEQMARFEDVFHILMAISLRSYRSLTGTITTTATDIETHKCIAISTLRTRLAQPGATADDAAILTMVLLALFEEGGENRREFRIHSRQVKAMLKSRGGISELQADTGTKAAAAQFHAHTADVYPSSQPISCTYAWKPVTAAFLDALHQIPGGFRELALAGGLSDQLVQMIRRTAVSNYKNTETDASPSGNDGSSTSYSRDYQDVGPPLTIPNTGDGPSFERAITQGLIRYRINSTINTRPRACLSHCLNMEVLRYLPSMTIPLNGIRRTSLQWVWLMAIDSWCYEAGELSPESATLLCLFRRNFPEMVSWTPNDFDTLGSRFFWTRSISKMIHACWDKQVEPTKKASIPREIQELQTFQATRAHRDHAMIS